MFVRQPRTARQQKHHDRACSFYKVVLKWQKEKHGEYGRNTRQAAIGLPEACRCREAKKHVKCFLNCARADGVPEEVLARLILKLVREKDCGR